MAIFNSLTILEEKMTPESFEKGKELVELIKEVKNKIFHLEKSRISSLYTCNHYHFQPNEELGEILKNIALAHLNSELYRLQREFKNL